MKKLPYLSLSFISNELFNIILFVIVGHAIQQLWFWKIMNAWYIKMEISIALNVNHDIFNSKTNGEQKPVR